MHNALHLFEGYGIEIEYMIIRDDTCDVYPVADNLLRDATGRQKNEVEWGNIAWSNELVLHLIELKGSHPFASLDDAWHGFQHHVATINDKLKRLRGRLLPGAVHPWMNPIQDTHIWPHDDAEIYASFDRIFGCRSHGWTNLQSMHINLPFFDDDEFGRLHAAIRLLLPIMPALSASSPVLDGKITGFMDSRLEVYRTNAQKIPSISGYVIPEPLFSINEYKQQILEQLYHDIAPYDTEHILQYEWLNARGAIARFERNTIEIRVLDVQECPVVDLAIAWAVTHVLKALIQETWCPYADQQAWAIDDLRDILLHVICRAEQTPIDHAGYLNMFGLKHESGMTAGDLWEYLVDQVVPDHPAYTEVLHVLHDQGTLATRMLSYIGQQPTNACLKKLLHRLADCLAQGEMFVP